MSEPTDDEVDELAAKITELFSALTEIGAEFVILARVGEDRIGVTYHAEDLDALADAAALWADSLHTEATALAEYGVVGHA